MDSADWTTEKRTSCISSNLLEKDENRFLASVIVLHISRVYLCHTKKRACMNLGRLKCFVMFLSPRKREKLGGRDRRNN